jgi:hypothetical protein
MFNRKNFSSKPNKSSLRAGRRYKSVLKSDKSTEYHRAQVAFRIDNEGHNFPRASRGYTPHKICLHSWKTHPPRSTEVLQGLGHLVGATTLAQRSTDASGILLAGRGERRVTPVDSSPFRVFSEFSPPCCIDASWIRHAITALVEIIASISKDATFCCDRSRSSRET